MSLSSGERGRSRSEISDQRLFIGRVFKFQIGFFKRNEKREHSPSCRCERCTGWTDHSGGLVRRQAGRLRKLFRADIFGLDFAAATRSARPRSRHLREFAGRFYRFSVYQHISVRHQPLQTGTRPRIDMFGEKRIMRLPESDSETVKFKIGVSSETSND